MAKVGLLGGRGRVFNVLNKSTETIIAEIGDNTGNLVFQRAAARLVEDPLLHIGPGEEVHEDLSRVRSECHAVIFPAANHIDARFDLSSVAKWLRDMHCPIVVLGIGTQAPDSSESSLDKISSDFSGNSGFRDLMSFFRESYVQIGVRGRFTQSLLARFDVPSVISGCPSFLLNSSPNLGQVLAHRLQLLRSKLDAVQPIRICVTACSPFASSHELATDKKLVDILRKHSGIYVQQSGGEVAIELAAQRFTGSGEDIEKLSWYESKLKFGVPRDEYLEFWAKYARIYFDVDAWRDELSGCDLSIGGRYHGNALAMQSGVPAIEIAHDSRTEELCTSTLIPFVSVSDFLVDRNLSEVLHLVQFDGEKYDKVRRDRANLLCGLFARAGIQPSCSLSDLAGFKRYTDSTISLSAELVPL
jgi:hypothetical protein